MFLVDATTSSSLPIFLQATAAISRERPRIVGSQSDITTYSEARSLKKKCVLEGAQLPRFPRLSKRSDPKSSTSVSASVGLSSDATSGKPPKTLRPFEAQAPQQQHYTSSTTWSTVATAANQYNCKRQARVCVSCDTTGVKYIGCGMA